MLRRALNSVLGQSYRQVRVRVYDNASEDDTAEVVREYASRDSRVEYIRRAENIGAQANLASGVADVDTPLFSILCDDDTQLPGFYENGVKALQLHPEAMFYCGRTLVDHQILGTFRHASLTWPAGMYRPTEASVEHMIRDHFIVTGVLFRSEIRSSVGTFAEHASDKSYMISAAATAPFVVDEAERAVFTIHRRSFSGGISAEDDRSPHDAQYVLQILRDAVAGLSRTPFAAGPGSRLHGVLTRNARREVFYSAGFQSLPLGRWRILGAILDAAEELDMPLPERIGVRGLRAIGRLPVVRTAAARAIRAVTRMISARRSAAGRNPGFEAKVAAYLAIDCSDTTPFD